MSLSALFLSLNISVKSLNIVHEPRTHTQGWGDREEMWPWITFPPSLSDKWAIFERERHWQKNRISPQLLVSPLPNLLKCVRVWGSSGREIEKPQVVLQSQRYGENIGFLSDSTYVCVLWGLAIWVLSPSLTRLPSSITRRKKTHWLNCLTCNCDFRLPGSWERTATTTCSTADTLVADSTRTRPRNNPRTQSSTSRWERERERGREGEGEREDSTQEGDGRWRSRES